MQEVEYFLPFDTTKHPIRISQGNNGPWSHFLIKKQHPGGISETDLIHAVDFALPIGTEVKAARDGRVFGAILSGTWCYEGLDPEIGLNPPPMGWTNHIIIAHEDETYAIYSHLGNTRFVLDDRIVRAGDVIAKTGRSGWIAETPHLHFQLLNDRFNKSLPIHFSNYSGSLDHATLLKEGKIWFGENS
jgi:murein DD-endopeptidase MepM/ murein hydrolase activator NlpD